MLILRDLVNLLQQTSSEAAQVQQREVWFAYTPLAVALTFASAIPANVLRSLRTGFGVDSDPQHFDAFMAC
jgi:hypothetical protein